MNSESTGCVMAMLEKLPIFEKLFSLIDEEDLHEKGIEHESHVTLMFGLHDEVKTYDVRFALEDCSVGQVRVNNLSLFESPIHDVLKMDVIPSTGLMTMRRMLEALPNTQKFPDYHPHMTIAYLKPGTGRKYITDRIFEHQLKVIDILYSYDDRAGEDIIYESIVSGDIKTRLW